MADDLGSINPFEPAEPEVDSARARVEPVMRAYEPSLRDRVAQWMIGSERPNDSRRNLVEGVMGTSGLGNQSMGLIDLTPAGIPLAGDEASREAKHGNWLGSTLNAMAMIPAAKPAAIAAKVVPRELNALNMYSHGAEAARNLPQASGTPEQMKAMLLKAGTKPDEFHHAAWDDFVSGKSSMTADEAAELLGKGMPRIEETQLSVAPRKYHELNRQERSELEDLTRETYENYRDELADPDWVNLPPREREEMMMHQLQSEPGQLRANNTKYHRYTIPGGENYREVLLRNPSEEGYRSSHWDEPNVLAHMRMSDRTGPEGQKILHLEELQSDWAQEARKKGFNSGLTREEMDAARKASTAAAIRHNLEGTAESKAAKDAAINHQIELETKYNKGLSGLPRGPYVDNTQKWTDLGLKRALTEAARGGYDQLIWTPGAEQAKRYGLSNHFERLAYAPQEQRLYAYAKEGGNHKVINASPEELPNYIGQDLTDKLLASDREGGPMHAISGVDLEMGGEGMKGYYDKIIPNQLAKLIKKLDPEAKIGKVQRSFDKIPKNIYNEFYTYPDREEILRKYDPIGNFPSIQITPRMREEILKGFPHFADGGAVKEPTEAQKHAGNYKKGHISVQGLEISVENPKGSMRRGQSKSGRKWECRMPADYGYFKSTTGADGDHVDVYIGPNRKADRAWVIDQLENGHFDEHKVMLGYNLKSEAIRDYCNAFSDGKGRARIGNVQEMPIHKLKDWLKSRHTKKPIEDAPRRFLAGA